jgi:hypothetical protein
MALPNFPSYSESEDELDPVGEEKHIQSSSIASCKGGRGKRKDKETNQEEKGKNTDNRYNSQ